MKKVILTANAPAPIGPYSQAIDTGSMVFLSGQVPLDPKTSEVIPGGIEVQAEAVMKNIEALLTAADLQFSNVVKTTIFLTDMKNFAEVNKVYSRFFKDQFPARSTVAVLGLPKGVDVEIEMIAMRA